MKTVKLNDSFRSREKETENSFDSESISFVQRSSGNSSEEVEEIKDNNDMELKNWTFNPI